MEREPWKRANIGITELNPGFQADTVQEKDPDAPGDLLRAGKSDPTGFSPCSGKHWEGGSHPILCRNEN